MTKRDNDSPFSRRRLLRSATVGFGATFLGAGVFRHGCIPRYEPWGDAITPPQQEHINKTYDHLYDMIETELAQAHKEGKKLAIVLGEHHESIDSLLIELMVVDIGTRLGISDIAAEITESFKGDIDAFERKWGPQLASASEDYVRDILKTNPRCHGITSMIEDWAPALMVPFALQDAEKAGVDPHVQKFMATIYLRMVHDLTLHPCDPLHQDDPAVELDKEREGAIVTSLKHVGRDMVSTNGGCHLIVIRNGLSEEGRDELSETGKYRVLALNIQNSRMVPGFLGHNDPVVVRAREVEQSSIEKVTIEGVEPSVAEAWEMATRASLNHRMAHAQAAGEKRAYKTLYALSESGTQLRQGKKPSEHSQYRD